MMEAGLMKHECLKQISFVEKYAVFMINIDWRHYGVYFAWKIKMIKIRLFDRLHRAGIDVLWSVTAKKYHAIAHLLLADIQLSTHQITGIRKSDWLRPE